MQPRAVLEPVYEGASDWRNLIHVHEVQVQHSTDAYQKVRASAPDRATARGCARRPRRGLRDLRARRGGRYRSGGHFREPRAPRVRRCTRWHDVANSTTRSSTSSGDDRAGFVDLGLRVAQIYEVQLDDVDSAIARYRRVMAVEAENQVALRALDRLLLQTARWADLAGESRRVRPRSRSPRTT